MAYPQDGNLHIGKRLGPYQIDAVLGSGGVATVYAARAQGAQPVALKILHPIAASQPAIRNLFQQEYKLLAHFTHPGIVRVYDYGVVNGSFYIALDLLQGATLEEFLLQNKKLGEAPAIDITQQVADALHYLHERQLVHRDIKPGNIFITQARRPILFDFGTALDLQDEEQKERERGSIYGTPAFGSPEQIQGRTDIDGRSDLYSLGVVLYRMISGRKPYYGSREEVLHAHVHEPPPPPSEFAYVSPELERIILKAMAKDPAKRFQTGAEFSTALIQVEPAPERPDLSQRILRWLRSPAAT